MEVVINSLTDVSQEAEITATTADLTPHFDKAYQEYRNKIEIRGFRKGKAPIDIVKKLYGEVIEEESLYKVATEFYQQAVKDKELKPIGEPVLVDMNYKRGEYCKFKIKYDIRPTFELKEYKNIEVEKIIYDITDKDVDEEIEKLRSHMADYTELLAVEGDDCILTVTMQDLDDNGAPIPNKIRKNVYINFNDAHIDTEIKDALKNAELNKDYTVKFEKQHNEHNHTFHAKITINKIEKPLLPELTDEFAKEASQNKVNTVEELKKFIRDYLVSYYNNSSERNVIYSIIQEIVKKHEFSVPESLIQSVLHGLIEDLKGQFPKKQLPKEFNIELYKQQQRPYAIDQAKWALIREEIIKKENFEITDEDYNTLAEKEKKYVNLAKEQLVEYYKTSEQAKDRIVGEKLMKMLESSAKIKEVKKGIKEN